VTELEPRSIQLLAQVEKAGGMFIGDNGLPVGLQLPPGVSYERYEAILQGFYQAHELTRFCIGDLIAYGEDEYKDDIYLQAVAMTGLSKNTLENYASASRLVPPHRRRTGVSHSIHVEVKSLPAEGQRRLLARAEREQLTKEAVRELVREEKGYEPPPLEREVCPTCKRPLS
jgi:hypothetical protein